VRRRRLRIEVQNLSIQRHRFVPILGRGGVLCVIPRVAASGHTLTWATRVAATSFASICGRICLQLQVRSPADGQHVARRPVVAFRPELSVGGCVDQSHDDVQRLAMLTKAAFDDRRNAQLFGDR
jgi:hypothetical protein